VLLGCGSDVTGGVSKSSEFGAVPVVMIKMEFLSFEHGLAASYAWCALGSRAFLSFWY
jgi:hypothetical protein